MFSAYMGNQHCCPTDKRVEAWERFIQGHEECPNWEKRSVTFSCQLCALCPEHWAVLLFSLDGRKRCVQRQDWGFVTKTKEGGKKGQNCSSLATVWGGYLQHLRLVDKDLRWEAKPLHKVLSSSPVFPLLKSLQLDRQTHSTAGSRGL